MYIKIIFFKPGTRLKYIWFLKVGLFGSQCVCCKCVCVCVCMHVCVYVCVCVFVSLTPRLLLTSYSGMMWWDMPV